MQIHAHTYAHGANGTRTYTCRYIYMYVHGANTYTVAGMLARHTRPVGQWAWDAQAELTPHSPTFQT